MKKFSFASENIYMFLGIASGFVLGLIIASIILTPKRYHTENGTLCKIEVNVRVNKVEDKLDIVNYKVIECL